MEKTEYPFVLAVDDDEKDSFLIRKVIETAGVKNPILFLKDGQALIDHLNENLQLHETDKALPCLILMDLNMPRLNGHETLKILKSYVRLRAIPVVILSVSRDPHDINLSLTDGAVSFYTKPADFHEFVGLMNLLKSRWLMPHPDLLTGIILSDFPLN